MGNVSRKSLAQLIDELITTSIKIYLTIDQEVAAQRAGDYEEAGKLGETVLKLNSRRRDLINAIDQNETLAEKSY